MAGSIALGVLSLVSAVVPLGVAWVGKAIVDAVVAGARGATLRWVLVELGLVAALALIQRAPQLTRSIVGARLGIDVNVMILEKAQALRRGERILVDFRHHELASQRDELRGLAVVSDVP